MTYHNGHFRPLHATLINSPAVANRKAWYSLKTIDTILIMKGWILKSLPFRAVLADILGCLKLFLLLVVFTFNLLMLTEPMNWRHISNVVCVCVLRFKNTVGIG